MMPEQFIEKWCDSSVFIGPLNADTFKDDLAAILTAERRRVVEACRKRITALAGDGDKPTDRLIGYDEAAQAIAGVGEEK